MRTLLLVTCLSVAVAGCASTGTSVTAEKRALSDTRQDVEPGQTGVFLTGYANIGVSHEF